MKLEGLDLWVGSFERDDISDEIGSDECSSVSASIPEDSSEFDLLLCSVLHLRRHCMCTAIGRQNPMCSLRERGTGNDVVRDRLPACVCAVCFTDRLCRVRFLPLLGSQ